MCDRYSCINYLINSAETVAETLNIPFLTLDFSSVNFRTSLRRHNVIYTRATFSRTKASAKWSVKAATHFSVASCMQIRAQFRLFQVKAIFKQYVNLMIWTWILRLQTASRDEFPCKNCGLSMLIHVHDVISLPDATSYDKKTCCIVTLRFNPLPHIDTIWSFYKQSRPGSGSL